MPGAADLAAAWLPGATFAERHATAVPGPPADIIAAVAALDDKSDALVRLMLQLREAPVRLWDALGGESTLKGRPRFGLHSFTLLERGETHLVLGLCGRFWRPDFGVVQLSGPEAFRAFDQPGVARLVMVYAVEAGTGGQRLATETRVHCPDRRSKVLFTPYWWAIRLGSGFIRSRILGQVRLRMQQRITGAAPRPSKVDLT